MASFRSDPITNLTAPIETNHLSAPITKPGGGGKFDHLGNVLPYAGNTFLCHVPHTSDEWLTLCDLQEDIKKGPFADRYTYLPPSSFHMTVFQGSSGPRRPGELWPAGVSSDKSYTELAEELRKRTQDLDIPQNRTVRAVDLWCGHSLTMDGADQVQSEALRAMRQKLQSATQIFSNSFETYTFHITLAYQLVQFTQAEAREQIDFADETSARYLPNLQSLDLGPVELCTFKNMHHFEPLAHVGPVAQNLERVANA